MSNSPTLAQASKIWGKIGLLSFGGPAAQIALMNSEIVSKRGWMSERQFLSALSFCMLLPGPEAMQLATYVGWRLNGTIGGLIAGTLFVLPGAMLIMALATLYTLFGTVPLIDSLFLGIKATVVIIVIEALLRVARKTLLGRINYIIAASAFIGIFFLNLPYPLIVIFAGLCGWFFLKSPPSEPVSLPKISIWATIKTTLIFGVLWAAPIVALWATTGPSILTEIAGFFSRLAVVTFGGAYAVLAYMTQDVVFAKEWLSASQMMDGLGLAETTPGPLILVTEFVGFLAGAQQGGIGLGFAAALVTLWVTFIPCFLWIFVGAPYIDWLGAHSRFSSALSAITAAVVGVILNLSIWFAIHVFFETVTPTSIGPIQLLIPSLSTVNIIVLGLTALAGYLLLMRHWNVVWVLLICGGLAAMPALY
ncbi:chromate transporter [Amylibacter marinus]|uniref:Chromate transporter n=1 Tax=Amylibacter marinus TaxID=1475483 RepID=A0ABQ5VQY2_9RHOB|nr:chromate efflux transporter [Amylibacter marinus]GLQ33822.1 chromate transporter [Amylibacter marinus]